LRKGNTMRKVFLLFCFTFFLLTTCHVYSAEYTWFGSSLGGDGVSWNDGDNWSTDGVNPAGNPPVSSDMARIQASSGLSGYPTIDSTTSAVCGGLFMGLDNATHLPGATLNIEYGGSLTTYPNPAFSDWNPGLQLGWYSDCVLNTAGTINTQDGEIYMGRGSAENGYGNARLNISDGSVTTPNTVFSSTSTNHIQLDGGILYTGTITDLGEANQSMDITAGLLFIDGDVRSDVDSWTASDHLTAYNQKGSIERCYNSLYPNMTTVRATATCDEPKWWDHFPRIVQDYSLSVAQDHNGKIGFNGTHQDPTWGVYGQKLFEDTLRATQFHNAGLKNISYYETFGESVSFIAELDLPTQSPDYKTIKYSFWNWQLYSGGTIIWVGVHNWFDNESFAQPFTRTHSRYGGPAMTYPDGTVATGYDGDPTDPRNNRVYDAGCSKSLLGNVNMTYSYNDSAQSPPNGQVYIPETGKYSGHISYNKDTACPAWADYAYASTLMAVDGGVDGMWTDNFGPWDNFGTIGYPATKNAFGEWSVARFRDYLADNFTGSELTAMGVTNVTTFDIRDKLIDIAKGFGWPSPYTDLNHWRWGTSNWLDEPLWRAYKIFKRQVGTEALTNYADAVHTAATDGGTPDFLICGNANPTFNLGWARGNIDQVSSEISAGWGLGYGTRGLMTPPVGRISPAYKMARDYGTSKFVNVWFYDEGYETYTDNPGLCWVLYSEMLASHTMPMFMPNYTKKVFGTEASNSDFFDFVSQVEGRFGKRTPVEDIGLYYSTSSLLNQITPLGFLDHNAQPHQFAFLGWGTALGQMQYQYRSVPEWQLDSILNDLRVLIIPESEVFDNSDVTNILQPWVNAGGRLIVTGVSGNRHGESGNFAVNGSGYSLSPLTGVTDIASAPTTLLRTVGSGKVYYIKNNIGMDYYNASTASARASQFPNFSSAMNVVLSGTDPVVLTSTDSDVNVNVGVTVYEDICNGKLFIDIVNYNLNLSTDVMADTAPLTFTIQLPQWAHGQLSASVVSPSDPPPSVSLSPITSDQLEITLGPLHHYASVIIDIDADADLNNDLTVNLVDLAFFADDWMDTGCGWSNQWCQNSDITGDNQVAMDDLIELINNWLLVEHPVAHWKFDETTGSTAADDAFSSHGTLFNFPTNDSQWTTGQIDGALDFDGVNDYVQISGYKGITGPQSRTVSAWIKTSTTGSIISWGSASGNGQKWLIRLDSTTGALRTAVQGGSIVGVTDISDNQWHHIAATLNDDGSPDVSEIKLYVDGIEEGYSSVSDQIINTAASNDVVIGAIDSTGYFNGLIDDVRIYSRAISPAEIQNIANP